MSVVLSCPMHCIMSDLLRNFLIHILDRNSGLVVQKEVRFSHRLWSPLIFVVCAFPPQVHEILDIAYRLQWVQGMLWVRGGRR